jgi:hypothetical protein
VSGKELDLGNRVLSAPVRAEPVRARLEYRLEDGFQHQLQACLDHPVSDCGNSQLAEFPIRFRYHNPPDFDGPEPARFQRLPDLAQESLDPDPGLDLGRGGPVDPCGPGAPVGGHALPRVDQERRVVDEVEQVTKPAAGIFRRPAVQLGLHTPYHEVRRIRMRPLHGAGIHRRIFGHCYPSLTDTLPPFPMCAAFPHSEYYSGSAPPAPFGWRRTYPHRFPWPGKGSGTATDGSRVHCHPVNGLGIRLYPCGIAVATP